MATKKKPTAVILTVTPQMAEEFLKRNHVNRRMSEAVVSKYARDMNRKRWWFCPDPIVFGADGSLYNGQHRLAAQVKSLSTVDWIVVYDAPAESQSIMDTQKARSLKDILTFAGEENAQFVAPTARQVALIMGGRIGVGRWVMSHGEILDALENHPDIRFSADIAARSRGGMTPIAPSTLAAAHWVIMQENGRTEADKFMHRIISLSGEKEGSPVLALNRRAHELRRARSRPHTRELIGTIIKAWNLDVQGKEVTYLTLYKWTGDGDFRLPEALPRNPGEPDYDV